MNIYDIAGNIREWTLEFYNESSPWVYIEAEVTLVLGQLTMRNIAVIYLLLTDVAFILGSALGFGCSDEKILDELEKFEDG